MGNACAHAYLWISFVVVERSRMGTASEGTFKKEEHKNVSWVTTNAVHAANADLVSILPKSIFTATPSSLFLLCVLDYKLMCA